MASQKELRDLIDLARVHGAIIRTKTTGADRLIEAVQIRSGIPGVGGDWMPLVFATEKLRALLASVDSCDTPISPDNAFAYNDNWQIVNSFGCIATEHNETEARALASYLTGHKGVFHAVKKNRIDQVRVAKEINPVVVRHQLRDEAFDALGIH